MPNSIASSTTEDRIFGVLGGILRASNLVSPRLSGRFLYWLWCHPIRHRPTKREAAYKATLNSAEFVVDGTTYRYYELGEGPCILAVHGWDGRAMQLMSFFAPAAAAGYKVITFDAQAHGESPGRQTNGVVIRKMILEVARQVGGLHAILAHSMGGSFAMASLNELAVKKVVLIAPPQSLEAAYQKVKKRLGIPSQAERLFRAAFERDFPNVWDTFSIDQIVPRLKGVSGLIVHDRDDKFVLPEEGCAIHALWEGSKLHLTDGFGHRRILRAEEVIDVVMGFLGDAPSSTPLGGHDA